MTKLQKMALSNMYNNILFFGTPKLTAKIVPGIGVNRIGVRNATPAIPNFFQIVTVLLFPFVNLFFFFEENRLLSLLRNQSPKKVNATTLIIIPATVPI